MGPSDGLQDSGGEVTTMTRDQTSPSWTQETRSVA